jgi:hypothetical protein
VGGVENSSFSTLDRTSTYTVELCCNLLFLFEVLSPKAQQGDIAFCRDWIPGFGRLGVDSETC